MSRSLKPSDTDKDNLKDPLFSEKLKLSPYSSTLPGSSKSKSHSSSSGSAGHHSSASNRSIPASQPTARSSSPSTARSSPSTARSSPNTARSSPNTARSSPNTARSSPNTTRSPNTARSSPGGPSRSSGRTSSTGTTSRSGSPAAVSSRSTTPSSDLSPRQRLSILENLLSESQKCKNWQHALGLCLEIDSITAKFYGGKISGQLTDVATKGANYYQLAKSQYNLADCYMNLGLLAKALEHALRAKDIIQTSGLKSSQSVQIHVDILIVTAMTYTLKSRFTTGQAFLEEAVKAASNDPSPILLPRILFASAKILVAMKKYGEAIGQLNRAEQMLKRSDAPGSLLADIYLFIGRVTEHIGNSQGALEYYMKSHNLYSTLPQTSLDAAECAYRIGTHYSEQRQHEDSVSFLQIAQSNYTVLLGPMHKDTINATKEYGLALLQLKDYKQALVQMQKVAASQLLAENSFAAAATNRIIGTIHIALKQYTAALSILELVLQKYIAKYGQKSNKVQEIEKTIFNIRLIVQEEEKHAAQNNSKNEAAAADSGDEESGNETFGDVYGGDDNKSASVGGDEDGGNDEDGENSGGDDDGDVDLNEDPFGDDADEDPFGADAGEAKDTDNTFTTHTAGNTFADEFTSSVPPPRNVTESEEFVVQTGPIPKDMEGSEDLTPTQLNDMQSAINDLESEAELVTYQVVVHTGSVRGAGTDASIFITIFGENGDSGAKPLDNSSDAFERGKVDSFSIQCPNLGKLTKISIGKTSNKSSGWFLNHVVIKLEDQQWFFVANKWFSASEADGQFIRTLDATEQLDIANYRITVYTGDVKGAGTDANVSITLYGERGENGPIRLDNARDNFERGKVDIFVVEGKDIGNIHKIRIGQDGTLANSAWFLSHVVIQSEDTSKEWYFYASQWFSKTEGDGMIVRELAASDRSLFVYNVSVHTGSVKGAGTDANVFVQLIGEKGDTGPRKLNTSANNFERGDVDNFNIECADLGSLQKLKVWHDNSGVAPGWFLSHIIVKCNDSQCFFSFHRWLAKSEDDGMIMREATPKDRLVLKKYNVVLVTGNLKGAGTDANVFINMFGAKGESGLQKLDTKGNNFERGQTDTFQLECPNLGDIQRIFVGHDNSGGTPGWFLSTVAITCESHGTTKQKDKPTKWYFVANKWFAKDEEDGATSRTLTPSPSLNMVKYTVIVSTAEAKGSGTDANVFIVLFGEKGDSGTTKLDNSKNNFERGATDTFTMECADLGSLNKIKIWHDGSGVASAWCLSHIIVTCEAFSNQFCFYANAWLDKNTPSREVPVSSQALRTYKIIVHTGDVKGAGTDANVFIEIYGDQGETGRRKLDTSANNFERAHVDEFVIQNKDVGNLKRIHVGHDNSGLAAAWFLSHVVIQCEATKGQWFFPCNKWFSKSSEDKLVERDISATDALVHTKYNVIVSTGDIANAGTDANVSITLFGQKGSSGAKKLDTIANNFERGKIDSFVLKSLELGDIQRIEIGHDGSGIGSAWFLSYVIVECPDTTKKFYFYADKWLVKDKTGLPIIELTASNRQLEHYQIVVVTGDLPNSGTDSNVSFVAFGDKGDSGIKKLEYSGNLFEKGKTDAFKLSFPDIGSPSKIRLAHDNSGLGSAWFVSHVVLKNQAGQESLFYVNQWFGKNIDNGLAERYIPVSQAAMTKYVVEIHTGKVAGAGTDSNVFVTLFGDKVSSGDKWLTKSGNNFERGSHDIFTISCPELGEIQKMKIWHDGKGLASSWFLARATVRHVNTGRMWFFYSDTWLSKTEGDKQTVREIPAVDRPWRKYKIMVYTADVEGAGTDANVHIMLVGPKGNSGKKTLDTAGNNFERGKTDTFFFNCADVGDVTSIQIGHDNTGAGPAWYLSQVVILCEETNKQYMFYCERWLAKDEDDGTTERELVAGEAGRHLVYVVTVRTGDKSGAGTDANVFITLYGEKGDCGQRKLNKPGNNFERGHADRFELKSRDLGNITKIKIGHDNSGVGSAWFLGHVIVQVKDDVKRLWYFESNRWFSTKEDDKAIVREMNASKELPPNIDINENTPSNALTNPKDSAKPENSTIANKNKTTVQNFKYKLLVQTGNISGAGTDANVLVTLYGDKGSSGTLKLDNKYNNFERGQKDEFNLDLPDIGNLDTVKISHDNTGFGPAWFLEFVIVIREDSSKQWFFPCNRWLAIDEEDHKIERELYVSEDTSKSAFNKSVPQGVPEKSSKPAASAPKSNTYKISVVTGKIFGAGTDANVFIILYGDKDTSSQYTLNNKGVNDFERGSSSKFKITVEKTLGKIKKIRIGHDNKGAGAAWFLDYVLIHSENDNMDYRFDCGKWLSKDEGDKLFVRDLLPLQSK